MEEKQNFARLDATYQSEPWSDIRLELGAGGWYEKADRDVDSNFLEFPASSPQLCRNTGNCVASRSRFAVLGGTQKQVGANVAPSLIRDAGGSFGGDRPTTSEGDREIRAWNLSAKATWRDQLDLLGGVRREKIEITSDNDASGRGPRTLWCPGHFPDAVSVF